MQDSPKAQCSTIVADLAQWLRNWIGNRAGRAELENFGPEELKRVATDIGLDPQDLRSMAGKWPESADLLAQRMAALGLDAGEIARSQPSLSNDLKRLCSMCVSKGQCEYDLAGNATSSDWRDYCPNATTLKDMSAPHVAQSNNGKKRQDAPN